MDELANEHGLEFDSTIGFNLPPEEIAVLIKKIIPPKNTEDSCKKIGEKLNDGKPAGKDHCASILEKLTKSSPSTGEKNKCDKIKEKLQSPADTGDSNDNTEKCKKIEKASISYW